MTLHEAIEKLLRRTGLPMTTLQIAQELNNNGWYQKRDKSPIHESQIRIRAYNYSKIFHLHRSIVSLKKQSSNEALRQHVIHSITTTNKVKSENDEQYVLNLCDKVLGLKSSRQHRFDFLFGDKNKKGKPAKLPVDSNYDELKLVIEYREKQHTESIPFFDKPDKMTVSGVSRNKQRKIYDERRRQVLPEHNITLIEISYSDFNYNRQKRIIRNMDYDKKIVQQKLRDFIECSSSLKR